MGITTHPIQLSVMAFFLPTVLLSMAVNGQVPTIALRDQGGPAGVVQMPVLAAGTGGYDNATGECESTA
jgi:hypothetical protein